jgi:hypothetical protein
MIGYEIIHDVASQSPSIEVSSSNSIEHDVWSRFQEEARAPKTNKLPREARVIDVEFTTSFFFQSQESALRA